MVHAVNMSAAFRGQPTRGEIRRNERKGERGVCRIQKRCEGRQGYETVGSGILIKHQFRPQLKSKYLIVTTSKVFQNDFDVTKYRVDFVKSRSKLKRFELDGAVVDGDILQNFSGLAVILLDSHSSVFRHGLFRKKCGILKHRPFEVESFDNEKTKLSTFSNGLCCHMVADDPSSELFGVKPHDLTRDSSSGQLVVSNLPSGRVPLGAGNLRRVGNKWSAVGILSSTSDTFVPVWLSRENFSKTSNFRTERPNAEQDTSVESPPINVNSASNGYIKSNYSTASTSVTGLAIVPVRVKAKGQRRVVETYAFLDSGSNTSFCTETLLEKLNFKGTRTKLSLTTLQGESEPIECSLVSLEASDLNESNKVPLPLVYSRSSLPIPSEAIAKQEDVDRWPYLKGVQIAHIDAEIGLLIGSDVPEALQPKEMRPSENGGPFATLTVLGWVLNGPLGRSTTTKVSTVNFLQGTKTLDEQFHDFCNQEFNDSSYESKTSMSLNDRKALNIMKETVQLQNGHYEMALPWKFYPPRLQNNRTLAERRLLQLKRRLLKEPLVHQKYKAFMDDLLSKDYARKVNCQDPGPLGTHWYLPHHPVFSPQKPDKVRVVFDCSAKYCNTSLNDQLLQGPDLTNSLVGVLSRFREDHVALMSDVEAMFHQVRVRPSDCDALRFLWWPDGNLDNQPEEYQMMVHLFGGASSPSCANFALKRTAEDNKEGFEPQTIETVKRNFYVDDCLKSVESEDKAIRLAKELRELLAKGGFKLTKWLSNSRKVIESLPESERAAQVKTLDFDKLPVERALGVQWNVASDQFGFSIVIKDRPATRRGILSIVSSVYDPLGFAAPFILSAKLILQDLCRNKYGWDDKIPDEYLQRWQAWLQELPNLEQLTIQRCFKSLDLGEIASCQLHHFSDASQ
ncbi:hypothetical protein ACROYT_G004049 [Oculina patagonica]